MNWLLNMSSPMLDTNHLFSYGITLGKQKLLVSFYLCLEGLIAVLLLLLSTICVALFTLILQEKTIWKSWRIWEQLWGILSLILHPLSKFVRESSSPATWKQDFHQRSPEQELLKLQKKLILIIGTFHLIKYTSHLWNSVKEKVERNLNFWLKEVHRGLMLLWRTFKLDQECSFPIFLPKLKLIDPQEMAVCWFWVAQIWTNKLLVCWLSMEQLQLTSTHWDHFQELV